MHPYIKLINILLAIFILFIVNKIYNVWKPSEARDLPDEATPAEALIRVPELSGWQTPPRKFYRDIVQKDLFRPERTEWEPPSTPKQEKVSQVTEPKIRVYGIVIYDGLKNAWIKEQQPQKVKADRTRRTRRSRTKKRVQIVRTNKLKKVTEGDSIADWKVSTIKPDAVVLKSGENRKEFHLIEHNDPKTRVIPKQLQIKPTKKKAPRPKPKKPAGKKGSSPARQPGK